MSGSSEGGGRTKRDAPSFVNSGMLLILTSTFLPSCRKRLTGATVTRSRTVKGWKTRSKSHVEENLAGDDAVCVRCQTVTTGASRRDAQGPASTGAGDADFLTKKLVNMLFCFLATCAVDDTGQYPLSGIVASTKRLTSAFFFSSASFSALMRAFSSSFSAFAARFSSRSLRFASFSASFSAFTRAFSCRQFRGRTDTKAVSNASQCRLGGQTRTHLALLDLLLRQHLLLLRLLLLDRLLLLRAALLLLLLSLVVSVRSLGLALPIALGGRRACLRGGGGAKEESVLFCFWEGEEKREAGRLDLRETTAMVSLPCTRT